MASKERLNLASFKRERFEVLARKATVLMKGWRRERGARLTKQLAVNSEVKQRWLESCPIEARQGWVANGGAIPSCQFQ